jgi:hypothetical protein
MSASQNRGIFEHFGDSGLEEGRCWLQDCASADTSVPQMFRARGDQYIFQYPQSSEQFSRVLPVPID